MSFLRMLRRFVRGVKSSLPLMLISLLISLAFNIYLLHLDSRNKKGSSLPTFFKKERPFYPWEQEASHRKSSAYDVVEYDVTDAYENNHSNEKPFSSINDMNRFYNADYHESLRLLRKPVDAFKSRDCLHTFFKSPHDRLMGRENFAANPKFLAITNITTFVPSNPLSKVRKFFQDESEVKVEKFCNLIREFEELNNVNVEDFPPKFRYKLSLYILRKMDYELKPPGAIIIGAKKGGTTALRFFLNCHPQLKTVRKELGFFRDTQKFETGLEFYRSKFDFVNSSQLNVEKSSKYFTSELAPQRIAETLGTGVKLILCIRNPVNRTISDFHHTSFLSLKMPEMKIRTPRSEGDRFVRLLFDDNGRLRNNNEFITTSLYSAHMKNWLKFFPKNEILIVREEKFRWNLAKVLSEVESFLEIKPFFKPTMFTHHRRTCLVHDNMEHCSPRWGYALPKPYINETIKQKLRDFFRPFNREFEKTVGQTFPWTNW